MRGLFLVLSSLLLAGAVVHADDPKAPRLSREERVAEASALQWQTGTIVLKNGLAKIELKPGWRFLDGPQAEKVLHDLWGNPPQTPPLGMIFPPDMGPLQQHAYGIEVDYDEGGHVSDSDAAKINYNDLLKQLQDEVREVNPERQKEGYPAMELVGWAAPPRYDPATHKLYWAKEFKEIGAEGGSLNYNVRILGRRGVLELTPIADMRDLDLVSSQLPDLLSMVDFKQGNTYAEFDPTVDKVAKYGIAGLVAGTAVAVAAKAGLFAGLGKLLVPIFAAGWKVIVVVFVAIVGMFKKIGGAIKGKSSVTRPFEHPPEPGSAAPTAPTLNAPPQPNREPLRPPDQPGGGFPPTKSF